MASPLDLQEQEQLDQLKAFWAQWGNLITWTLAIVFGAVAAYNGWNWYQRRQGEQAAALYDQMQQADKAQDAQRAATVFGEIKDRYGSTAYAANAGLLAARTQVAKGQADEALKSLAWVADNAKEDEVKLMARLAAAGVLLDKKQYDEALKQVDAAGKPDGTLGALVSDRRGDILMAQGKAEDAKAAYQAAYRAMDEKIDYRQVIDAKLAAMGASPSAATASSSAAAPASAAAASAAK